MHYACAIFAIIKSLKFLILIKMVTKLQIHDEDNTNLIVAQTSCEDNSFDIVFNTYDFRQNSIAC